MLLLGEFGKVTFIDKLVKSPPEAVSWFMHGSHNSTIMEMHISHQWIGYPHLHITLQKVQKFQESNFSINKLNLFLVIFSVVLQYFLSLVFKTAARFLFQNWAKYIYFFKYIWHDSCAKVDVIGDGWRK